MDDTIKLEDFDFDNILIDGKSQKNVLICGISYETLIGLQPLSIIFVKPDKFIMMELNI